MADDDDRWTIRGVAKKVQEEAKAAAGRLKVPVGDFVMIAIEEAIREERKPIEREQPLHIVDASRFFSRPGEIEAIELENIERAIAAAVTLAAAPAIPVAFRRRANRVLRDLLPRPPPGRRPGPAAPAGLLPAPESETPAA